jgi:hypothetical protein
VRSLEALWFWTLAALEPLPRFCYAIWRYEVPVRGKLPHPTNKPAPGATWSHLRKSGRLHARNASVRDRAALLDCLILCLRGPANHKLLPFGSESHLGPVHLARPLKGLPTSTTKSRACPCQHRSIFE